jgi:hypothetical protein
VNAAQMKDLKGYNSDEERGQSSKHHNNNNSPDHNEVEGDNAAGVMFKSRSSIH